MLASMAKKGFFYRSKMHFTLNRTLVNVGIIDFNALVVQLDSCDEAIMTSANKRLQYGKTSINTLFLNYFSF